MHETLQKLAGGDRRSLGRTAEVVADVLNDPPLFETVFNGMLCGDPLIRMRSADAAEKITAKHPEYLQPFGDILVRDIARIEQKEVRWHVAQMLPRLSLDRDALPAVVDVLMDYLDDKSRIVKTFAMQALADLAQRDQSLLPRIVPLLHDLTETGSPAMRARGRKILERLWKAK